MSAAGVEEHAMNYAMNEFLQRWSQPWHALQRHVAEAFCAQSPEPPSGPRSAPAIDPECGSSWLARARCAAGWRTCESGR